MEVYRGAVLMLCILSVEVRTFIEAYECTLTSFFSCNCVRRCTCACVCVCVCVCMCVCARDEHIVVRYVARSRTVCVACTRCTQHVCCNRLHPPHPLLLLQGLLAALLYSFPVHSQGGCASNSCYACKSSPANCTLNDTTSTIRCSGDTSECTVTQCAGRTHCVASYYKANVNMTAIRFISGCTSIEIGFKCDSTPTTCVASGSVGSKELLFDTSGISCTCYSDNCTSSISYNYTVDPSLLPPKSSSQSPLATNPLPTNVPGEF